jgi:glycosyltransferase involved in cell wall biosynthesis
MRTLKRHILLVIKNFPHYRTEPNTANLVKYLGRQGWVVDVLCSEPGWGVATHALTYDEGQLRALHPSTTVHPVLTMNPVRGIGLALRGSGGEGAGVERASRRHVSLLGRLLRSLLHVPDSEYYWLFPAVARGLRLIKKRRPDLLLTSGPPFTTHLAGWKLKTLTGIPWVCHSRDLFLENPLYTPWLPWRRGLDRALERLVVRGADAVTTVYPEATELLRRRYSRPGQLYRTVRNGYDEELFAGAEPVLSDRFTVLYGGRLAAHDADGRTGWSLLDGFELWLRRRPELRTGVRLKLVGRIHAAYRGEVERRGLSDVVEISSPVPLGEMIGMELGADVLVIILEDSPKNWFTAGGKVYECARAGKPVLGVLPENAAARIVREKKLGLVARYGSAEGVAGALDEIYWGIMSDNFVYGGSEREVFVRETSFERLAEGFGELFGELLG